MSDANVVVRPVCRVGAVRVHVCVYVLLRFPGNNFVCVVDIMYKMEPMDWVCFNEGGGRETSNENC